MLWDVGWVVAGTCLTFWSILIGGCFLWRWWRERRNKIATQAEAIAMQQDFTSQLRACASGLCERLCICHYVQEMDRVGYWPNPRSFRIVCVVELADPEDLQNANRWVEKFAQEHDSESRKAGRFFSTLFVLQPAIIE